MGNLVSSCGASTPGVSPKIEEIAVKVNNTRKNENIKKNANMKANNIVVSVANASPVANTIASPVANVQQNTLQNIATTAQNIVETPAKKAAVQFKNNALENVKLIQNINRQLKEKKVVSTSTPATSILKPNTRTNIQKVENTSANPEDVLEQSVQRALQSKSIRNLNTFMKKKQITDVSKLTEEQKRELVERAKKDEREIRQNGGKLHCTRRRRA
jgi:hypothetical protein